MKKNILTLVLFLVAITFNQAQEIKSVINQDALAKFEENPKKYLLNWEKQELIGFELIDSKHAVEATLHLNFITPKGQWQSFTSEPFKLFPGNILFPGTILFPGNILEKLPKGKCLILFDLQINNYENLSLLRKLPGRIPVVFNN